MKSIKRSICILSTISIIMSLIGTAAVSAESEFIDIYSGDACYDSVVRLGELGIINGYEDGSFRPDNEVTRAEFCKIIVAMMNKVTEALSTPPTSAFDDVNKVLWCIPYVNYLTGNGVIKGYADATFKPANVITYAEAVTIICRVLGYTEEDIGYSWPANYINEAKALELCDRQLGTYDSVTRSLMAQIVDNALFTYVNGKSETSYIESIGYSIMEDSYIIAVQDSDASLNSDEIRTNDGVYTVKNDSILDKEGKIGTLILDSNKKAVSFKEEALVSMTATVTGVDDNNVIEYKTAQNGKGSYTFTKNFTIYSDNTKMTYNDIKNDISEGTVIQFMGEEEGRWTFALIDVNDSSVTPVKASRNYTLADTTLEGIPIEYEDLTVYRNNKTVTVADIKTGDVVYYNTKTNVMDVYTKSITGIYSEALPSKAYVTSVNVGGNIYQINSKVSTAKLDATEGSFDIGDRVTLLLGKNDEVCFAVESSGFDKFNYGVVLKTYTETAQSGAKEGSTRIMASVFMPDGNTYEYETVKNYKDYIGDLVMIGYEGDVISMSKASSSGAYGEIDTKQRTLGTKSVQNDVAVIHRLSEEDASQAEVELLNFDTLDEGFISSQQLITSVSANAFGDVAILYLCDMASGYSYGYLRGSEDNSNDTAISVTYRIYSNSVTNEYVSDTKYSAQSGAVYYKLSNGKLSEMKAMYTIASAKKVNAVEEGRIMVGDKIYKMSDDVQIIDASDILNYKTISVKELAASKSYSATLYSEKPASENGVIRIVKVTK